MKKVYFLIVIVFCLVFFTACSSTTGNTEHKENQHETKDRQNNSFKGLTEGEIKTIMVNNFNEIHATMENFVSEHPDWSFQPWLGDENSSQYKEAVALVEENLTPYITKGNVKEYARSFFDVYFFIFEGLHMFSEDALKTRFTIEKQEENRFAVSSIEITDEAGYFTPGTHTYEFIKEDGKWKFHNYKFIDSKDKSLNLTSDDILENLPNNEVEILGEMSFEGESYIIIQKDASYKQAIHKQYGTLNHEVLDYYVPTFKGSPDELIKDLKNTSPYPGYEFVDAGEYRLTGGLATEVVVILSEPGDVFTPKNTIIVVFQYSLDTKTWSELYSTELTDLYTDLQFLGSGTSMGDKREQVAIGYYEGSGGFLNFAVLGSADKEEVDVLIDELYSSGYPEASVEFKNKAIHILDSSKKAEKTFEWDGNSFK